jgi:hypothetical protein
LNDEPQDAGECCALLRGESYQADSQEFHQASSIAFIVRAAIGVPNAGWQQGTPRLTLSYLALIAIGD